MKLHATTYWVQIPTDLCVGLVACDLVGFGSSAQPQNLIAKRQEASSL